MAALSNARGEQYGDFHDQFVLAHMMKALIRQNWPRNTPVDPVILEGLDMILTKVSRAVCGAGSKVGHRDTFDDIAGYAKLLSRHGDDKRSER